MKKSSSKGEGKVETVSVGGVVARIYPSNTGGYTSWLIRYYVDGKAKSLRAVSLDEAKKKAKDALGDVSSGSAHVASFTPKEAANLEAAINRLRGVGVPILEAVTAFCEAHRVLDGEGSLIEAARYYIAERKKREIPDITIPMLVVQFLEAKEQDQCSRRYLDDARLRLATFKKTIGGNIANVTSLDIDTYLRDIKGAARSRHNSHVIIRSLFSFARSKGYLPASEKTAAEIVGRIKMKPVAIGILKPEEFEAALRVATPKTLPSFVLGGFCGLRQAEIFRLDWSAIDFKRGKVTVNADIAKTARRRLVPLPEAAIAWLTPIAKKEGRVIEYSSEVNLSIMMRSIWEKAKVQHSQNCLRHSAASYRLAQTNDAAKTALELGNSPKMLMEHYRELVTEEDAAAWFSIKPDAPKNILQMGKKAA